MLNTEKAVSQLLSFLENRLSGCTTNLEVENYGTFVSAQFTIRLTNQDCVHIAMKIDKSTIQFKATANNINLSTGFRIENFEAKSLSDTSYILEELYKTVMITVFLDDTKLAVHKYSKVDNFDDIHKSLIHYVLESCNTKNEMRLVVVDGSTLEIKSMDAWYSIITHGRGNGITIQSANGESLTSKNLGDIKKLISKG